MKKLKIKIGLLPYIVLFIMVSACGGGKPERVKLSAEEIESKYASGVVLIKNSFYYTISFNGGKEFYFTGLDEDGDPANLTLDPNEITPSVVFGTGFFVSKDGLIATNSHVASPGVDISSARSSIMNFFREMANEWSKNINEMNEQLSMLQLAILGAETYYERNQYEEAYQEMENERNSLQEAVNMIHSLGGLDYEAAIHTDLGIAYNDTHVTNMSDFHACVMVADDPSHDLAIVQLKDKKTPEGKHVFKVPGGKSSNNNEEESKQKNVVGVGKKLYMIGYNLGPTLALTNQGVKAQVTSGEISQDTDEGRIMYTISALQGSSGSPVIDSYGKLVAVNYAGLNGTQNFNYGVKASHLKKLLLSLKDE